jgi:alpha-glucosidase
MKALTHVSDAHNWWRRAVIYQVYLRSFADGNGDGIGDIAGLRARLAYLARLGVDALWITPWYPSPMADGGYDVADFRDIDPLFGTLDEAQALVSEAHARGIRILVDIVPNHTSAAHPWFGAALAGAPGSAARARYIFRDGLGPDGSEPPNNWISAFGGPAWSRVAQPDGTPGQWYLHLFAPEQPDLDWTNPEVAADFEQTLRFWFDRGIDGFRIDVAMSLVKDPALPDLEDPDPLGTSGRWAVNHPYYDREGVHEIWRSWRRVADEYDPPRTFVGEVALTSPDRLAQYLRPDELHSAFNFDFLKSPWDAGAIRDAIDSTRAALGAVRAPSTWVLSNHDEPRHVTRFGLPDTGWRNTILPDLGEPDLALGTRRARAAALLLLALPGSAYVYQGEELGLWYIRDIPDELLQDPSWERSGHVVRGRDGSRVPIPWEGSEPPFGFGPAGSTPWLPQPPAWAAFSVEAESAEPDSMLSLYRSAVALRRTDPGLAADEFAWCESPPGSLVFERGGLFCAVNLAADPMALPVGRRTILRSDGTAGGDLTADTAEWFRVDGVASAETTEVRR